MACRQAEAGLTNASGYFILNHATLASSHHLFAQLWKEYALSDSRYLTSDPFMLSVETLTVLVWGPLCLLCALTTVTTTDSHRHPLRILMCMAHLHSVALYYATSLVETSLTGQWHSRPEFQYFWIYYAGFNIPWAIVPACECSASGPAPASASASADSPLDEVIAHADQCNTDQSCWLTV
jgi:hypothetical protein